MTITTVRDLLVLPDGRRLAWHDLGDPSGTVALYLPGTPTSGLAGLLYDDSARRAGIRWISLDKPGYGGSDRHVGAGFPELAADVRHLTEHLGVESFVAVGESGGGPQALALGALLTDLVRRVVVLSGMGAYDRAARQGMKVDNRFLMALAAHAPRVLRLPLGRMGRELNDPVRAAAVARKHLASMPADEKALIAQHPELLEVSLAAAAEALRDGPAAAVEELRLFTRPWGFTLADVTVPVDLWHGTADRNVPVQVAERVAAALPSSTTHLVEGGGHSIGLMRVDDVMATIARAEAAT
ncbi:MAG: alpha/beta hydrolase [Actinomycetota bacterium]|nr:alpha/beta hydrolase [Actinomycetota bacterium]